MLFRVARFRLLYASASASAMPASASD